MKKRRLKRQASKQEESKLQDVNELIKELDNDLEALYLMSIDIEKQGEELTNILEGYRDYLLSIDI